MPTPIETGQPVQSPAPTLAVSAAVVGPAWIYAELVHAKVEITQRRGVAMAWKLGLLAPARDLGVFDRLPPLYLLNIRLISVGKI